MKRLSAYVWFAATLLAVQGCEAPVDPAAEASARAIAEAPTDCPRGLAKAMGASMNVDSTHEVKPRRVGLGALNSLIACVVKDTSAEIGDGAVIIMRADTPENEVRYALERLGFDQENLGWGRSRTPRGQVDSVFFQTYGSLARNLTENNPKAFGTFRDAFPTGTVVLGASIRGSKPKRSVPKPILPSAEAGGSDGTWRCSYSPTYNNDWHDDGLCTNGVETERPYLRAGDSFITEAEFMESLSEYERYLNGR